MSDETPPPAEPSGKGASGSLRPRARTAFGPGGWFRRLAKLWGFLGFCVLVVVLARHVVLPFVFALLIGYILAPLVRRLSVKPSGDKRMPRGLAIVLCYLVLLSLVALFFVALMPRISQDIARIGSEAPALYKKLNDKWAPQVADWLEERFPSLKSEPKPKEEPVVADVPLPPGTGFVVTPLPDGRYAIQLQEEGLDVAQLPGGGYNIAPREEGADADGLEERLRVLARKRLAGLQSELGNVFKAGQQFIAGLVRSIFLFFLVLMIAAFILLDINKIHRFVRGLVPGVYRTDYDVIVAGIDSGLAGVIRGQLIICLVNGVLTYIGLMIFSVKYSLILAVVAAVLSLIPIFGSILSTIPIVLAALVSGEQGLDVMRAIIMVGWIVGIHFLEANFLNPKIIGSAAKIHPVLVIFSLILGEHSFGLVGALLAVPILSIVQVLFLFFRNKAWKQFDQTGEYRTIRDGEEA
jgi:predicted PurR-regulated permease PerM